jgi:hypothetical protein
MPPITDPTAIPASAPMLRELINELVEIAPGSVDKAAIEVEVLSTEVTSRCADEAVIEVKVLCIAVVLVEDSSTDEQVPNSLWHLFKSKCRRHLKEFRRADYGNLALLGCILKKHPTTLTYYYNTPFRSSSL